MPPRSSSPGTPIGCGRNSRSTTWRRRLAIGRPIGTTERGGSGGGGGRRRAGSAGGGGLRACGPEADGGRGLGRAVEVVQLRVPEAGEEAADEVRRQRLAARHDPPDGLGRARGAPPIGRA